MLQQSLLHGQKFTMNPQVYQFIKLLDLPVMELREKIAEELERNPALEVLEDPKTISLDAATPPEKDVYEFFESSSDSGFVSRGDEAAAEQQRRFIEGALSRAETLQDHLLWQIRLEPLKAQTRRICELLIQNLDDNGFHEEPVDILLQNEDSAEIEKALAIVQALDPAGTCTSDYMESLRVQTGLLADAPKGILDALSHLELLEKGKTAEAAKKMGLTVKEAEFIFAMIKELSPFPGRRFAADTTRYVIPDIEVTKKDGEFVIILNEEEIPVLGINPFFMKVAEVQNNDKMAEKIKRKEDKPVRDFAQENIKEARWFINCINQRNHTLLKISRAIVEFQRPFFVNGPKHLAPLTLGDISSELDIHQTTVSRIAHGKYMQTEWGIFELRHFFTNSISGTGSKGSIYSKKGVKEVIREIIKTDHAHLSDKDIVKLLEGRGINLARRTVAKYRGELDLGSSFERY